MIDTKALRSRILDLAIQGKLTQQLESDGTAEELYQQIQAEKNKVKEQPCVKTQHDISYNIPSTWFICSFNDINCFITETTTPLNTPDKRYELYSVPNYAKNKPEILQGKDIGSSKQVLQENDILVCKINPRINRVWVVKRHTSHQIIGSSEWIPFRNYKLDSHYLCYYFQSPFFRSFMQLNLTGVGGSLTRAKPENVKKYPVILPPLAEQKRIVERVEEIFKLLDTIDEAQAKYSADTEILKAKLITAGIQGKLTQQLPSDGTAEELYQQIQAEKLKLIKEGKIKKEKPLPPIADEEIPFEIPGNWKWVRLGSIITFIDAGKSFKCIERTPNLDEIGIIKVSAVSWGVFQEFESKTCFSRDDFNENYLIKQGDFLISRANTTELVGACVIVNEIKRTLMLSDKTLRVNLTSNLYSSFLLYLLRSKFLRSQIETVATGTSNSMKNISQGEIKNLIVPLPPLTEQKRIAETLEKVLGALG